MNRQVFNQIRHCCHQSVVDVFATRWITSFLCSSAVRLWKQVLQHLLWRSGQTCVFAQGLGPAGVVTCICLMSQTVSLGKQMYWTSLGRVWSVMSSGPHPSGDSTDDHLQVQNHHDCVARDFFFFFLSWFWYLVDLSTKPLLRLPLGVNLLTQPFSNRLHNNLVYLNLHVWHLEVRHEYYVRSPEEVVKQWRSTPQGESENQLFFFGKWCEESQVPFHMEQISWNTSLRKHPNTIHYCGL